MGIFSTKTSELIALTDPANLQYKVLEDLEDRINNSSENSHRLILSDPHNVFNNLVEMTSVIASEYSMATHHKLETQHVHRAQTSEDLYLHMSDFDYLDMFSSPAPFIFKLTLDKNHLFVNAKKFNEAYKKVIIPRNTIFKLGRYKFGIHYPIEIRLNETTKNILTLYDTSTNNPLEVLGTNVIESYEHASYQGQEYLTLLIPVWQFTRTKLDKVPMSPGQGYTDTFTYTDKFYGARFFTELNGETIELRQTLANGNYDPFTPTVRLYLESERSRLKVNIPQVYFNKKLIGSYITAEIFTTLGELDVDVSNVSDFAATVDFNLKDVGHTDISYSKILLRNPASTVIAESTKLVGGSNGYTFTELRQRTMHNTFHEQVAITPMDFEKRFQDYGFSVKLHLDNLTQRIYYAYKLLTDGAGSIVHTKHLPIKLTDESPIDTSTILTNYDKSITILPTTIYQYDNYSNSCVPLTDKDFTYLQKLGKEELVDEMNLHNYMKSPFHIRLITNVKYPRATSYNLMDPEIKDFVFDRENTNTMAQMTSAGGYVQHLKEGAGGYEVQLLVKKSPDLEEIPEDQLVVYAYTTSGEGAQIGIRATFAGTYNNQAVYKFNVDTDYWIDEQHRLYTTNLQLDEDGNSLYGIQLESKFNLVFLVSESYFPNVPTDQSMYEGLPTEYRSGYMCMIRQHCTVKFGDILENVIYNDVDLNWSGKIYLTHPVDVPLTYPTAIYELDENGVEKWPLVIVHQKGDPVLDDKGQPIIKNHAGDVIINTDGTPTVKKERVLLYYIHALMIDAKIYVSEDPDQISYRNSITSTLSEYFSFLTEQAKHLLEQTELYFRPFATIGTSKFYIGESTPVIQPLASTYKLRCHVPAYVLSDSNLQTTIEKACISLLEQFIIESTTTGEPISLTDIAKRIRSTMPSYVVAIDVLGINGSPNLQTMTVADQDAQPSIATKLIINKDGKIVSKKDVDIEFALSTQA